MKRSIFLFGCAFFLGIHSFAQTLFISDIDDTIKITHVLDRDEGLKNSLKLKNLFTGMPDVYELFSSEHPQAKFYYVTNAPEKLMYRFHAAFVSGNGFPRGEVLLRDNPVDTNFKVKTIRKLIQAETPRVVVLVGDNGEKDISVYDQVKKEHPDILFVTFIHQVYSVHAKEDVGAPLAEGQTGFVTSVDLLRKMISAGLITQNNGNQLLAPLVQQVLREPLNLDEGSLAIPRWVDCRDYVGVEKLSLVNRLRLIPPLWGTHPTLDELLNHYDLFLKKRCTTGPRKAWMKF